MRITVALLMVGIFIGCTAPQKKNLIDLENTPVYPSPPDEPRLQFLRAISTSLDITQTKALDRFLFGSLIFELQVGIEKPYGIATHKGKIYICDTMLPGLIIIDLENQAMTTFNPQGRGVLRKPINVAVDREGSIFVTDTERKQVVVYSNDLSYQYALTSDLWKPIDIAILGDSILVTDYEDRNVEVWSKKYRTKLGEFPPYNSDRPDSERVYVPYSIATNSKGNIYITDFGQFRILCYTKDGKYIKTIGGVGTALGSFARPKGIAVDKDNILYVVDSAFENVQMFDDQGRLLMFFGGSYKHKGDMYLPAQITIDSDLNQYFTEYVLPGYKLNEVIMVTNQYGPDKITFYGKITPINHLENGE